uniref:ORF52 n=1 Tax=Nitrosopumilaceae spindle-shaped virus TaxID=3065433 RepID=A0AAT9JAA6_9VIRU
MHEFGKKVLDHIGTSHHTEHELNETEGFHHEGLGEFEKRALDTKKHHNEESF